MQHKETIQQIQFHLQNNNPQVALDLILKNLELEYDNNTRIFLYFSIIECYIRLGDFDLANKNISAIQTVSLNQFQLFQFYFYIAVIAIQTKADNIQTALSDLINLHDLIEQEIDLQLKVPNYNKDQLLQKKRYIKTKMAEVSLLRIQIVNDVQNKRKLLDQTEIIAQQAHNAKLDQLIRLNKILYQDSPDLEYYEQLCHQYVLKNPTSQANRAILFNYMVLLLKNELYDRFDEVLHDTANLEDDDQWFEFLRLVGLYLRDQYDQFNLGAIKYTGQRFKPLLQRIQAIVYFNECKYDQDILNNYDDLKILKDIKLFNYADALKNLDQLLYEMEQSGKTKSDILNIAGIVFLFQNKLKQSAKIYNQILQNGQQDLGILNNYANLLCRQGDTLRGTLLYSRVLSLTNDQYVAASAKKELIRCYKQLEQQQQDGELKQYYKQKWQAYAKE